MDPNVLVAIFAFLTAIITVAIPQLRQGRKNNKHAEEIKEALGEKNGNGSAMQMMARLLGNQMETLKWSQQHDQRDDERFQQVEESLRRVSGQVAQADSAAALAATAAASAAASAAALAEGVAERLGIKESDASTQQ